MNKILLQGSNNTIGDFFFSMTPTVNFIDIHPEYTIDVALRKDSKTDYLYENCRHVKNIIKLDSISDETIYNYGRDNNYSLATLMLKNFPLLRDIRFHPLYTWFKTENLPAPNIIKDKYTLVHVTSSANYDRPKVPHFNLFLEAINKSGSKPLFIGTEKDEELFKQLYPECLSYKNTNLWRFGQDSVFQTIANISICDSALVFSSWSAYAAVLLGVSTMELWHINQHNLFNPLVKLTLGNPIHLLQDRYDIEPVHALFTECLPIMKHYSRLLYDKI
jgi:hypothetical protein